jgi:hypothetical protein
LLPLEMTTAAFRCAAGERNSRAFRPLKLRLPSSLIVRGSQIEYARGFALQDVEEGSHLRSGRPVRARIADLYRVKGQLTNTLNDLDNDRDNLSARKCV